MLNKIKIFLDTHSIGQIFHLGHKKVVWKKVTEIKPGQKIAIIKNNFGNCLPAGEAGKLPACRRGREIGNSSKDVVFDEVISIKKIPRQKVYDIEVQGTHNFVGNGIIAHNTKLTDLSLTPDGQVTVDYNVSPEVLASLGYSDTKNEIETAVYSHQINTGLVKAVNLIADNILAKRVITPELKTTTITPLDEITDTIVIDGNLSAQNLTSDNLKSDKLTSREATFSTLYADQIINPEGNISDVMAQKITDLRAEITNLMATSEPSTPSAIALDASTWDTAVATASTTIDVTNMTISDSLIIGANLIVNGQTNLSKLYVSDTLAIGQIAIKDNNIETTAGTLFIQPSGIGTINFLNSKLIVSDDGSVTINAKLAGTDATFSGSLIANLLKTPNLEAEIATIGKINISTDSALPVIANAVIASASAAISTITTNASAGTAILPAGSTELKIANSKIKNSSMVYLTPNGSTNNQVVYVKNKTISSPSEDLTSDNLISSFTIGIDSTLPTDLSINWWIIN